MIVVVSVIMLVIVVTMVTTDAQFYCHNDCCLITMVDPNLGWVLSPPLTCCALHPPIVSLPSLATHRNLVCASVICW